MRVMVEGSSTLGFHAGPHHLLQKRRELAMKRIQIARKKQKIKLNIPQAGRSSQVSDTINETVICSEVGKPVRQAHEYSRSLA
jgi:hypothetical protein